MNQELKMLEQQLLDRIDNDDLLEVKKVKRYIKLLELDTQLNEQIEADGITLVTENGQQRFVKSHPLLNEKAKLNSQLIALEKTINFVIEPLPTSAPASSVDDQAQNNNGYSAGDLV